MKKSFLVVAFVLVVQSTSTFAQNSVDPLYNISVELTKISGSVATLNTRLKEFVDKFEKVPGTTFDEKQQKMVLAMEMLVRAEQRVANLQLAQIEFVSKLNENRAKLTQVESDLRPRNIDRSVAFEGTTETEEVRDSRRQRLQGERSNLTQLVQQIQISLEDTAESLRDAQALVKRLRRQILPEIERELFEKQ
ncbi:MAG: hypothetical protein WBO10_16590 [Pyrinomonadaceae bacterium]